MISMRGRQLAAGALGLAIAITATAPAVADPSYPPTTPKTVTFRLSSVAHHSKLKIDVDPDLKGSRYYTFRVYKWQSNRWVSKGSYRTQGKKETRTLNFGKGTYRAVCSGKYGYEGATSAHVTLKR